MDNKAIVLTVHRNMGAADALALREKAVKGEITDTEIIDREEAVPEYSETGDYTGMDPDTPYSYKGQVYGLIQGHNAAHYTDIAPGTKGGAPFWRIKHTTNPAKAKPWVQPTAENLYKAGECMIWTDGKVKRAKRDTTYSPDEYAPDWEDAEV